ncbi:MAG: MASE1 domain-containing protein, partial [Pseudomonadota bacterium]|nr:MASE1 domain-containing protein [Pseudomonadota bacterium]
MTNNPPKLKQAIAQFNWVRAGHYLLHVLILASLYYAAAWLGMFLEGGQRGVMPIPLPAGIALAALLLFGMRLWPGIVIGLLTFNIPLGIPLEFIIFSAAGATLQALSATWLLRQLNFQDNFSRVYDVLLFTVMAVLLGPLLGSSLALSGPVFLELIPVEFASQIWLTRWFSDGIGMLVISSTLLIWRQFPPERYQRFRWLEWGLIMLVLIFVSGLTLKVDYGNRLVLLYTILPFAVWAGVRFEQHGATLAAFVIAAILLNGGLNRVYPTGEFAGSRDLLLEIGFIGITSFTAFLIAAAYTERRRAQEQLYREKELALTTLHSIADAVITTDEYGQMTYLNPVAEELIGWSNVQAMGQPLTQIFQVKSVEAGGGLENPIERCLHGVVSLPRRSLLVNRDQNTIAIEHSAAPIRSRNNKIEGVIMVFHDVSKEQHLREQLSHQASHDALTGLCNRREFEYQLSILLNQVKVEDGCHSFLYLDLDQFKIVNDSCGCGHAAGDALLKQLVTVVQGRVRAGDIFARLGGDEFGILLKNCPLEQASIVAESFLKTVRDFRFVWEDKTFE